MNLAKPRAVSILDDPLTPDELIGRDDHTANVWRLVVDICSSSAGIVVPRRYSDSNDEIHESAPPTSVQQRPARICIVASEADPHCFNSVRKTQTFVVEREKLPYTRQSVADKLLNLLGRRSDDFGTEQIGESKSHSQECSSKTTSEDADNESLAALASNDPSAWKKVQSYVQKNDKGSTWDVTRTPMKPKSSPSTIQSTCKVKRWERVRNLIRKWEISPKKTQRQPSDHDISKKVERQPSDHDISEKVERQPSDHDISKSVDEFFGDDGRFRSSPISSNSMQHSSSYLSTSVIPAVADDKLNDLGVVSNLFPASPEKEEIEEEGYDHGIRPERRHPNGTCSRKRAISLMSSVKSALRRLRRRRQQPDQKRSSRSRQADLDEEEPSLTVSRSLSVDVTQSDLVNMLS